MPGCKQVKAKSEVGKLRSEKLIRGKLIKNMAQTGMLCCNNPVLWRFILLFVK